MSTKLGPLSTSLLGRTLAMVLTVLLIPPVSWMESGMSANRGSGTVSSHSRPGAFQASGQSICGGGIDISYSPGSHIIQKALCVNGTDYTADLEQFESDAVNEYLALHNLPSTDASVIYSFGRADLRNAIRGQMLLDLEGIIAEAPAQRSSHQQNLYNWLQYLVQQNEIAYYQSAISQYQAWQNDPCGFTLDPTIAQEYNLSYSSVEFCYQPLLDLTSSPPVPAESYFLAYGLEHSYGNSAFTYPSFASVSAGTILGLGLSSGALVAVPASAYLALGSSTALYGTAEIAGATIATNSLSGLGLALGPAAIVLIGVLIAVTAGMEVFSEEQTIQNLNNLSNTLTQVTNTPPNLYSFATDTSGLGLLKLTETLDSQTMPDVPSTQPLPTHREGADLDFLRTVSTGASNIPQAMLYHDWNGISWLAQTYGGWFVQTCNSSSGCPQADSILASIDFVDWSGVNWTAQRFGQNFLISKASPASTDVNCPADQSGVTPIVSSNCKSYVSASIQLQEVAGDNNTNVTYSLTLPPTFTNAPTTLSFTTGHAASVTITASGLPVPTISASGNLPQGVTFSSSGNGSAQVSYDGSSPANNTTSQLVLSASNNEGPAAQETVTVIVGQALQITSVATPTFTAGVPVNFLITTTGYPTPALTLNYPLPGGLSFTDKGNGTATITGTIPSSLEVTVIPGCALYLGNTPAGPNDLVATNASGSVGQCFYVGVNPAPSPIWAPSSATFIWGLNNSIKLVSTGAITPVTWYVDPDLPQGLSFKDNGDGTGVLSMAGIFPLAPGTYSFQLYPVATGGESLSPGLFTLTVSGTPVFETPNTATFTVGTNGSFSIVTNDGNITSSTALPGGLSLQPGLACVVLNCTQELIEGTPAAGSGGSYAVQLNANYDGSSTSQQLTLNIYEAPTITSATSANFFLGQTNSFPVTTTGFPNLSTKPVSAETTAPTNPDQGLGMFFTVTGLPSDLTYSNLNSAGFATGTLVISGTPSLADVGSHTIQIAATNGVGASATQTFTLNIGGAPGDVNLDGVVNCVDYDLVKAALGKYRGQAGYSAAADVNNDGVVDIKDLTIVAKHLAKGTACH